MKYLIFLISFLFSINLLAQDSSIDSLSSEVVKAENPSGNSLQEIYKIKSFDSTFAETIRQYAEKNGSTEGFSFDFSSYYDYLRKIVFSNENLFIRKYAAM